MTLLQRFEQFDSDHFLEFAHIENKLSSRPDLHAFLLLDSLVPGILDMVGSASHDQIWLEVDPDDLEKVATDDQIKDLVRCGVFYDEETDSLSMFV